MPLPATQLLAGPEGPEAAMIPMSSRPADFLGREGVACANSVYVWASDSGRYGLISYAAGV
jgi:hypothetical protein